MGALESQQELENSFTIPMDQGTNIGSNGRLHSRAIVKNCSLFGAREYSIGDSKTQILATLRALSRVSMLQTSPRPCQRRGFFLVGVGDGTTKRDVRIGTCGMNHEGCPPLPVGSGGHRGGRANSSISQAAPACPGWLAWRRPRPTRSWRWTCRSCRRRSPA